MQYDVLLTKIPGNGYVARPFLWPELTVSGATEADVLVRNLADVAAARQAMNQ